MILIENLPVKQPVLPKPTDFSNFPYSKDLYSKGLAEDLGKEMQYESERHTIRMMLKLALHALHTGSGTAIEEMKDNINIEYKFFVGDILSFVNTLWNSLTYFQRYVLYLRLINEFSFDAMSLILGLSPESVAGQFKTIAASMNKETKYDRLHELIKEGDKWK